MGRSVTCTYQVNVNLSNGQKLMSSQTCYGAMSFKEVQGIMRAEADYQKDKGVQVISAEVWPQTARGRNSMKGNDFAIMSQDGKLAYYTVGFKSSAEFERNGYNDRV